MNKEEAERRIFKIELEKVRLMHRFMSNGLMLMFFCLVLGGLFLIFKPFNTTVLMVIMVGLMVTLTGLIATPRLLEHELNKLKPKE